MTGPNHASSAQLRSPGWRPGAVRGLAVRQGTVGLVLALTLALVLGACAVKFGNSGENTGEPPSEQTPRDRNQLYQQEQQRIERNRQLDRSGPSDR